MKIGHKWYKIGLFDPNFSCSNIHIVYNTANNAVNYIQKYVFRVKIVLFKKKIVRILYNQKKT